MKIIADQYLYALQELIPDRFELETYDPEQGIPKEVDQFDALLVRTVSKINRETLPRPGNLKFIGTAAAGFDHIDVDYLDSSGIKFARSAGCNANAVAEYVLTVLYRWCSVRNQKIEHQKIGVIGCGHTGGALIRYLEKLGVDVVSYDPPKAKREEQFISADLTELFTCDVLSFHTPLTAKGSHSTYHLCDEEWLKKEFKLIINASRGGVVDEKALYKAMKTGTIRDYILDVWENEPVFSDKIADQALIATPHIAGYSREAKWKASEIVIRKMVEFFGEIYSPPILKEKPVLSSLAGPEGLTFSDFLWKNHKIDFYHQKLDEIIGLPAITKGQRFADLRSNTTTRFEFKTIMDEYPDPEELPDQVKIF